MNTFITNDLYIYTNVLETDTASCRNNNRDSGENDYVRHLSLSKLPCFVLRSRTLEPLGFHRESNGLFFQSGVKNELRF